MNVIVHDNWLNPVYFNVLKEYILSTEFAWYKGEVVEDVGQVAPIKTQPIFEKRDQFFALIHKIGWFLNAKKIIRAKLNYGSKTNEPQLGGWHVDYDYKVNPNDSDYKIAILYINTNNGYTLLENGQEILSVENRVVIFDNSVLHTDCSQTDIQGRIVLNIVYCE